MTVTKEKSRVLRTHCCTYSFNHLTIQEFFTAVALVSNPQEAESMIRKAAGGQLDLVFMFLCGLVGDPCSKEFLDSLDCQVEISANRVLQLVVEREKRKEEWNRERYQKQTALLLLLMIYESRNPNLWSTVAGYVMSKTCKLDPMPTHFVKQCHNIMTVPITNIINKCLIDGMPDEMKYVWGVGWFLVPTFILLR